MTLGYYLVNLILLAQTGGIPWVWNTNMDGDYRVKAPGQMIAKIVHTETPVGTLSYHTSYFQHVDSADRSIVFMMSYLTYPDDIILEDSIELQEELMEASIDEAVQSVNGTLLYAQDDYSYSLPGKFWRINYLDGQAFIKTKALFRGNKFYTIQIIAQVGTPISVYEEIFFSSLQWIPARD